MTSPSDAATDAARRLWSAAEAPGVGTAALVRDIEALAAPVLASGIYPSPNPIGLPVDGRA